MGVTPRACENARPLGVPITHARAALSGAREGDVHAIGQPRSPE